MSELDDLVAIFGRIDDAVVHDPDLEPKVAAMLPPYRQGARGWYRALQDWRSADSEQRPQLAEPPDLEAALHNFEEPSDPSWDDSDDADLDDAGWATRATRNWLNARRMLACATLSRIQGYLDLPNDAHPRALLTGVTYSGSEQELHDHLRRAGDYPSIESWPTMMEGVRRRGIVQPKYINSTYVPPMSWEPGSFRVVDSRITGPSVALRTHHHITNLTLDEAKRCLDPRIWDRYRPPWCSMEPVAGAPPDMIRCEEVIAANCDLDPKLTTVLDFLGQSVPDDGAILEYRIPDGAPVGQPDRPVTIDEGSLEVRPGRAPGYGIHFVTTKRIQFEAMRQMPTMTLAGLAFLVWVLGWDTLSERFIYFCAKSEAPSLVPPDPTSAAPRSGGFWQGSTSNNATLTLLNLGMSGFQTYVRDCVGSVRSSMQSVASGSYGLADYLTDLTKVSNEITTNTTALASFGTQMWRAVSDTGGPEVHGGNGPGPQPGQPDGSTPNGPGTTGASKRANGGTKAAAAPKQATKRVGNRTTRKVSKAQSRSKRTEGKKKG